MKKIEEQITGGEIYTGETDNIFQCIFKQKGEVSPKYEQTTYETELKIPYKITIKKQIEPGFNPDGTAQTLCEIESYTIDIRFPFDQYSSVKGEIRLHASSQTLSEIPHKILEAIGNNLLKLQFKHEG